MFSGLKPFLRKYIPFAMAMKAAALLLINPLLNGGISLYLNSRGRSIAYNYDLFWGFLTVPGLIALALAALAMLLFSAFEIGVVLLLLRDARDRANRPLAGVMSRSRRPAEGAGSRPRCRWRAAYFLLLLPFERMGYLNSLLSRVEIPAFVLGELQLTHAGVALILAFHALVLAAFYLLIFVPVRMLLGQERFLRRLPRQCANAPGAGAEAGASAAGGLPDLLVRFISAGAQSRQRAAGDGRLRRPDVPAGAGFPPKPAR